MVSGQFYLWSMSSRPDSVLCQHDLGDLPQQPQKGGTIQAILQKRKWNGAQRGGPLAQDAQPGSSSVCISPKRGVGDVGGITEEPRGLGPGPAEAWLCCVPAVSKALPTGLQFSHQDCSAALHAVCGLGEHRSARFGGLQRGA